MFVISVIKIYVKRKTAQATEHAVLTDDRMSRCINFYFFTKRYRSQAHLFKTFSRDITNHQYILIFN